jgi:hypothetical protein
VHGWKTTPPETTITLFYFYFVVLVIFQLVCHSSLDSYFDVVVVTVMELVRLNGRYRLQRKIAVGSFGKFDNYAIYAFVHNSPLER